MRASTPTKLTLYDFAKIMGINPLHFAQVNFTPASGRVPSCAQAYVQYDWQDADRISRESIAYAIAEAEERIERYLKYRLAPTWEVDEWHQSDRPNLIDRLGYSRTVKADWGWFVSGGIEAKTLLDADAPIIYSDEDSDGYDELATVTATVPLGTEPCEVAVYYPNKDADDSWEIRPINVSVSGVTATITFRREQAVIEAAMEEYDPSAVDGTDDTKFLEEVDVYRHWNDPQTQATLMWEPGNFCNCGNDGCAYCSYSVSTACLFVRGNPKLSLLSYNHSQWSADDDQFVALDVGTARQPDTLRLYYYAGLRNKRYACPKLMMDNQWKRTVAHFAASLLDKSPCDCAITEWEYWREDMSLYQGSDGSSNQKGLYRLPDVMLDNPFGQRRGMLQAWEQVKRQANAEVAIA